MKVQIINKSKHPLPQYATSLSAGMDVRANLDEPLVLKPLQRCLVPTGLYMAIPAGYEYRYVPEADWPSRKESPYLIHRERLMPTTAERYVSFW